MKKNVEEEEEEESCSVWQYGKYALKRNITETDKITEFSWDGFLAIRQKQYQFVNSACNLNIL